MIFLNYHAHSYTYIHNALYSNIRNKQVVQTQYRAMTLELSCLGCITALPLTNNVVLSRSFNLSKPHCPNLYQGDSISAPGLWDTLIMWSKVINVKARALHNHSVNHCVTTSSPVSVVLCLFQVHLYVYLFLSVSVTLIPFSSKIKLKHILCHLLRVVNRLWECSHFSKQTSWLL